MKIFEGRGREESRDVVPLTNQGSAIRELKLCIARRFIILYQKENSRINVRKKTMLFIEKAISES